MDRRKRKRNSHRAAWLASLLGLLLLAGLALWALWALWARPRREAERIRAQALEEYARGEYQGVFLGEGTLEAYDAQWFSQYRGEDILIIPQGLGRQGLLDVLGDMLALEQPPARVYLELRSVYGPEAEVFLQSLETLVEQAVYTQFLIQIFPRPLEDWRGLSPQERLEQSASLGEAIERISGWRSISLYYMGDRPWMAANPSNYREGELLADVAKTQFLLGFVDGEYAYGLGGGPVAIARLEEMFADMEAWAKELELDRQSQADYVFLGDSLFGNYRDTMSIPGVTAAFSGSRVWNCAVGGSVAADMNQRGYGLLPMAERLSGDKAYWKEELNSLGAGHLPPGVASLWDFREQHKTERRLLFILNHGVNDYMSGLPLEDVPGQLGTKSALALAIDMLAEAYPHAEFLIMTPGYITYFDYGREIRHAHGGTLMDYVEASQTVAATKGAVCLDSYAFLDLDPDKAWDYLEDGCHPNAQARYMLGREIARMAAQ